MKMTCTFLLVPLLLLQLSAVAQVDSTTPPYKRFPGLPPIQLLLGDSTTRFTKNNLEKKPVLVMLFSPDCSHCQHAAEELGKRRKDIRGLQVVMATFHELWQMNEFAEKYRLREVPGVVVGKDIYYTLPSFFAIRNLPFYALYDKKGNLLSVFEGGMEFSKVLEVFREKK